MDGDHPSFSRALHLPELLDYLAVGRVAEEDEAGASPASARLIKRIDGDGNPIPPIQHDDEPKNGGSPVYGAPFGLHHQPKMLPHPSVDSSGTFTDAEDARLQFMIVCQHIVVETDYSLVLTYRAA